MAYGHKALWGSFKVQAGTEPENFYCTVLKHTHPHNFNLCMLWAKRKSWRGRSGNGKGITKGQKDWIDLRDIVVQYNCNLLLQKDPFF